MKYGLEIKQITEDGEQIVVVDAYGVLDGEGCSLAYKFDGAEYELKIGDNVMTQSRKGEVNLFMQFIQGQETACKISGASGNGTFAVFTRLLEIEHTADGIKATCEYTGAYDEEITTLRINAYPMEEL